MAAKTRSELNSDIDSTITDNGAGAITGAVLNARLSDLADSAVLQGETGRLVKTSYAVLTTLQTGTTPMELDDTIPQNTEGDEYLTLSHTPEHADNILEIEWMLNMSSTATSLKRYMSALFKGTDADALASGMGGNTSTAQANAQSIGRHRMTAGGTSQIDFKVRAGVAGANTTTINGLSGGRIHGGVMTSYIKITEYRP